ncbi:MAG TPA: hypothetical protein VF518_02175, partial [Polyangia bacterium]
MSPSARRSQNTLAFRIAMSGLAIALGILLVLPFVALLLDGGPLSILRGFECTLTLPALRLSLETTAISVVVVAVCGTPL